MLVYILVKKKHFYNKIKYSIFLFLDVVPVAIRPPHAQNLLNTLSTVKMMVELSQAKVILTNSSIAKLLRCKVRR